MIYSGINTGRVWTADQLASEGDAPSVGSIAWVQNKCYKFVLFDHGTETHDLIAGDVVYYVDATGYEAGTVTADVSDSSGQEIGAGIVTTTVTEDGSYFWVQIKGAATAAVTLGGSAADGDPLTIVGAVNKALARAVEADTAGVYKPVVAYATDASAKKILCDFPF